MNKRIPAIFFVILIGVGIVLSIKDYKKWRWEETKNYGHGPIEQLVAAEQLTKRYENSGMGIRLGYPSNWVVTENPNLVKTEKGVILGWRELLPVNKREKVVTISIGTEVRMEINLERLAKNETYGLEDEVNSLKKEGVVFVLEREYINTDRENWMVLTWEEGDNQVREAITIKDERLVTVKVVGTKKSLNRWKLTEDEVIKSVKIF